MSMTQEEKQLLIKDLCARIPYGLFCQTEDGKGKLISVECSTGEDLVYVDFGYPEAKEYDLNEGDSIKPYLRPMSSMTEEEKIELCTISYAPDEMKTIDEKLYVIKTNAKYAADFYNEHHFDYRGLIPMGLALEAKEGMYKTE